MDGDATTPGMYIVRQCNRMTIVTILVFVSTVVVDAAVTLSRCDDGAWEFDAGCAWTYIDRFRHYGPYSPRKEVDALKHSISEVVAEVSDIAQVEWR